MAIIFLLPQSTGRREEQHRKREEVATKTLVVARATVHHLTTIFLEEDRLEESRVASLVRKLSILGDIVDMAEQAADISTSRRRVHREVRRMIRVLEDKFVK